MNRRRYRLFEHHRHAMPFRRGPALEPAHQSGHRNPAVLPPAVRATADDVHGVDDPPHSSDGTARAVGECWRGERNYCAAMSLVTYDLEDHVATITLNRPEARNAINGALRRDLNAAWDRFRDEEDAWVGILTANGSTFCAGGDLKDSEGSVGTFGGTFWEKPTINSFESGWSCSNPQSRLCTAPALATA